MAQDVERVPADARAVRTAWFGVPAGADERWPTLDEQATAALAELPAPAPTRIALVRESTIGGRFVGLAAVDGLAPHVILRSGRLPRTCRPERCEVVRLRGVGRLPDVPGLRVVQVGTGTLRSRQLFGDFLAPTDNALADAELAPALAASAGYHRPPPGPLVVAEGVAGLMSSPVLARSYRSYGWVQPLTAGTPRLWEIDRLIDDADRARAALQSRAAEWSLGLPVEELDAAKRDATVAGRRLLLVGGEAAALLIAFAVLAAGALRRDLAAARRRLMWHGATAGQRRLLTATESAAVGFGGAVLGWVVGAAVGAAAAALADAPALAVLRESVLSPSGLLLGLLVSLGAGLVVFATVSLDLRRRGRVGTLEVAAVLALLAALGILASGAVDGDELAEGGAAPIVLLALPGLIGFAAAVGAARLLPVVGGWLARRGSPGVRLAGVSLARSPGAAAIAAAFLALAIGLAALAESYRATLARGEHDRAAFAVPADVVVRENLRALVPVLRAASLERFRALPGVEAVDPVVRVTASAGPAASVSGVTVLGAGRDAVERLPLWRGDWGLSRSALVDAVTPDGPVALRGPVLHGRDLRLAVGPSLFTYLATIRQADGAFRTIEVGDAEAGRPTVLTAPLPPAARGGRLVSLTLRPPRLNDRGADSGVALRGRTTVRIPGVPLDDWVGLGGVEAARTSRPDALDVRYAVTYQRVARIRPRQPTDASAPAAVVTPRLGDLAGGAGGTLPLRIGGEQITVRVADVVDRIPGTTGDAVLVDEEALRTAVDADAPGRAPVSELWLDVAGGGDAAVETALARPPFAVLATTSRARAEADASRDPLAHGTLLALGAAALVALVLAVAGLVLAVRADLRDDRGELADLEAQGAAPRLLRRTVVARAAILAGVGVAGGILAGAVLAVLVTRVVSVTARAEAPEPPLVTSVDPVLLVVGALAAAGAAALLVALTTRRAFSSPRGPGRIGGEA